MHHALQGRSRTGATDVNARIVHIEFNRAGTEFWVSAWGRMDTPSFIVVY